MNSQIKIEIIFLLQKKKLNNDLGNDNIIYNSNIPKRNNKVIELDKNESNYNESQRIINNPNYISTNSNDN